MTHDRELLKELNKSNISKVRIGNGEKLVVKGTWTISIKTHSSIKLIFDVLYVPEITQNFLSVAQMLEKGYKVSVENKVCVIKNANNIKVFKVYMKDKIFVLDFMKEKCATNKVSMKEGSKLEDKYLRKKVDVQVKEVDGGSHSNIHKRSNATTIIHTWQRKRRWYWYKKKYKGWCEIIERCDAMEEREKQILQAKKKMRKSSIKRWRIKYEDIKFK